MCSAFLSDIQIDKRVKAANQGYKNYKMHNRSIPNRFTSLFVERVDHPIERSIWEVRRKTDYDHCDSENPVDRFLSAQNLKRIAGWLSPGRGLHLSSSVYQTQWSIY